MKASVKFTTFPNNPKLPLYESEMMAAVFSHSNDRVVELFNGFMPYYGMSRTTPDFICEHPTFYYNEELDGKYLIIDTDKSVIYLKNNPDDTREFFEFPYL